MRAHERLLVPVILWAAAGCATYDESLLVAGDASTAGAGGGTGSDASHDVSGDADASDDGAPDPACAAITCDTPPGSFCADATHLAVYATPGTCSGGACAYASHQVYCSFGCANDACSGDPCAGVVCDTLPPSYCSGASELTVYDLPGTCAAGHCSYGTHKQFCASGCSGSACTGDPCDGVTCTSPPAGQCAGPATFRTFTGPGTCDAGACTYPSSNKACPGGCASGVCKACGTATDCASAQWCDAGSCAACDTNEHCGAACTDCTATSRVCDGTTCVQCLNDAGCPAGNYCAGGTCSACNTAQKCGSACVACGGTTPACGGSSCVCSGSSCGSGARCVTGACEPCNLVTACGATCAACGGSTPDCLDQGTASKCVRCLTTPECASGEACVGNACLDACAQLARSYDFEANAQGFTHSPTSGGSANDPWALGTPSDLTCHGGSSCWATNLSASGYSNCQTAQLLSPTIDLTACFTSPKFVKLSFWQYYAFQPFTSAWPDGGVVQISSNNGASWADVTPIPAYQGVINGGYGGCASTPPIASHNGWSGAIPGGAWVQVTVDIPPAFQNASFRARWLFGSDGSTTNRGWLIDDIAIVVQ